MRETTIIIEGEPRTKQRPRFNRTGKKVNVYTPQKTKNYEKRVAEAWNNREMFSGALKVKIEAFMRIPKKCKTSRPTKRPDIDNIAKIIMDGLNKVAWEDDKQVVDLRVIKAWSNEPRVEVTIREVVE